MFKFNKSNVKKVAYVVGGVAAVVGVAFLGGRFIRALGESMVDGPLQETIAAAYESMKK